MAMMISKFHKIIQSKIVWTVFAILISVAFVGVYTGSKSSSQKQRSQQASQIAGTLYGEEVTRQEFGKAYRDVYLVYSLMVGRMINETDEIHEIINKAAWIRLVTLKKAEQLGLGASKEQTIAMIQRQPVFRNQQTGQFDKNAYDAFISNFLSRFRMGAKEFEQLMAENVVIEKASAVASQGALVTEDEIKDAFHLYTDMLTVDYAAIPRSLADTPAVTEAEAAAHFEQNKEQFRMPEKAIVNYIQFAVADYADQAIVTDEMVESFYENNKQRFLKPDTAEGAEPEYQPLDEVRESITQGLKMAEARKAAADIADAFVADLADENTTFSAAAEKAGYTVVDSTPAFTLRDRVKGVDPTAPFARAAFGLEKNEIHYYSDPVVGRDFVYVIALNKKLPSFLPSFDIVKKEAMESARIVAAEKAYAEKAASVRGEIKAALQAGKTIADAAARFKLELQTTQPFNVTTQLEDEFGQQIKDATMKLDAGALAELIPASNEFLIAYVSSKETGDETAELPAMREGLAAAISNEKASRMAAAWQESLLKEANFQDRTEPKTDEES